MTTIDSIRFVEQQMERKPFKETQFSDFLSLMFQLKVFYSTQKKIYLNFGFLFAFRKVKKIFPNVYLAKKRTKEVLLLLLKHFIIWLI